MCKRYGLNVMDRYDNGNNDWLIDKAKGWVVAYHGVWSPGGKSTLKEDNEDKKIP